MKSNIKEMLKRTPKKVFVMTLIMIVFFVFCFMPNRITSDDSSVSVVVPDTFEVVNITSEDENLKISAICSDNETVKVRKMENEKSDIDEQISSLITEYYDSLDDYSISRTLEKRGVDGKEGYAFTMIATEDGNAFYTLNFLVDSESDLYWIEYTTTNTISDKIEKKASSIMSSVEFE